MSKPMTRAEALEQASHMIEDMLRSGDARIYDHVMGDDGKVNTEKLYAACARARERIADKLMGKSSADS